MQPQKNFENRHYNQFRWQQCAEFGKFHIKAASYNSTCVPYDCRHHRPYSEHIKRVLSDRPPVSNPDVASVAMMGGFIVRTVSERITCADRVAMLQAPKSSVRCTRSWPHHSPRSQRPFLPDRGARQSS